MKNIVQKSIYKFNGHSIKNSDILCRQEKYYTKTQHTKATENNIGWKSTMV